MKILIVSQYFWPEEFCINELAASLVERGHGVEVLTGIPNYPGGSFFDGYGWFRRGGRVYRGIRVHRVPLVPRGMGGSVRLILNYFSFVLSACFLGPFKCRNSYDLILVYEPSPITVCLPALLLKLLKSIPVVFWVQDLWPESISATGAICSPFILRLVGRLVRFIYRRCDKILIQSEAFRNSVVNMGGEPRAIEYFPNGADSIYKPLELALDAPERKELPDGFRIIFAGNVGAAQDFRTILAAAELLKECGSIQWIIIGSGRRLAWVEMEIQKRKLENTVCLLGRKTPEAMPRYLSLADALLVTLREDPIFALTIPTKVQAYLACGKPIIAAMDGEGARIVQQAAAGLTCPAQQPDALASRVFEMFTMDKNECRMMGERGRAYFENHFERALLLTRLEWIMSRVLSEENCISESTKENNKCNLPHVKEGKGAT